METEPNLIVMMSGNVELTLDGSLEETGASEVSKLL